MVYDVTYKSKQFLLVLIKLAIVVGAFCFIYLKITRNNQLDFSKFTIFISQNNRFTTSALVFLLLLSGLNWFFEIAKWHQLVKTVRPFSFYDALEQTLSALTASLITPNRIGDYGVKAIYFEKPLRVKIIVLNVLGNLAQLFITLIFGLVGLYMFSKTYVLPLDYNYMLLSTFSVLIICIFLWKSARFKRLKIKGLSVDDIFSFIRDLSLKTKFMTLGYAFIRYVIFSTQFYVLFILFGVNLNYETAMITISSFYILVSIIPSFVIADVVVKGSIAVLLFGYLGANELVVLSTVTLMWLLNFILPSIIGSYFVLKFKFDKVMS